MLLLVIPVKVLIAVLTKNHELQYHARARAMDAPTNDALVGWNGRYHILAMDALASRCTSSTDAPVTHQPVSS